MSDGWIKCSDYLPDEGLVVQTKLDDENGCRNGQPLKRLGGLWLLPDVPFNTNYTPTHWRPINEVKQ